MEQSDDDAHEYRKAVEIKCELLEQQYKDPAEREKIDLKELLVVSKSMAEKLRTQPYLDKGLHVHLRILRKLLCDKPEEIVEYLEIISEIMLDLSRDIEPHKRCTDAGLMLCTICLQKVSSDVKFDCFCKLGNKKFEICFEFLTNAWRVSLQFQMLQVLCSFVENATDPIEQLCSLFADKLSRYTYNAIKSVKWCPGSGIPLAKQLFMLEHINLVHTALHNDRWIFSESIESIKFDDHVTVTCTENDGKFYMNKKENSIEFLITYASAPLVIHINAKKLKNVQIIVDELPWVHEMRLELNAPPGMCDKNSKQMKAAMMDVKGEYMDVTFVTGFNRCKLLSLFSEMFGITPEIIKRSNHTVSDADYDSDLEIVGHQKFDYVDEISDDETKMESILPFKSLPPVNQSTPKATVPIKTDRIVEPNPKSPLPSPVAAKEKVNQYQDVFVKPKSPPSQNVSTAKQSPSIPCGSFYGKKTTNDKISKKVPPIAPVAVASPNEPLSTTPRSAPRRSRRKSAVTARGKIQKTLEQSQFDFDENENGEVELKRKKRPISTTCGGAPKRPKRTKKPAELPKWPVLNIEINKAKNGKKEPRKLFTIQQDLDDDDYEGDKSVPKTPKMVKRAKSRESIGADLTPASFRSSRYIDPMRAQNRVLENVMKINERVHKKDELINPNASYSYLRASNGLKRRKPSQVIYTQADSTSPNTEQNEQKNDYAEFNQFAADGDDDTLGVDMAVDINCNHEKDTHRQMKRNLKNELHGIKDSVNRAIELLSDDESDGVNDNGDDKKSLNEH